MADINDYKALVTSTYRDKSKFMGVIETLMQPYADMQSQLNALVFMFDVDDAGGDQLDIIGEWVGLSRTLRTPIPDVYFSFDTVGLGFNEGVWFNGDSPAEGVISLDDGTYRLMLKAKIEANNWDGSLFDANEALVRVFGAQQILLIDNFDMTISIDVSGTPPSVLFEQMVEQGYLPFRPAGVALAP